MQNKKYSQWMRYTGLTAQLLVMIALGVYGGIKLDEKFKISPALTILLPLLVLTATFYKLIKETNKKNTDNADGE